VLSLVGQCANTVSNWKLINSLLCHFSKELLVVMYLTYYKPESPKVHYEFCGCPKKVTVVYFKCLHGVIWSRDFAVL